MATYNVYMCQYSRERYHHYEGETTRHHEIVVVTSTGKGSKKGTAFHVIGAPGSWKFEVVPETQYMNMSYCGRLALGTIPGTKSALDGLECFLRTVPIGNNDPRFNCQRWVWDAAVRMRDYGYHVDPPATFQEYLSKMHTKAYADWNSCTDSD